MHAIPLGSVRPNSEIVRYPQELVKYVRTEYGEQSPEWLLAEALGRDGRDPRRAKRGTRLLRGGIKREGRGAPSV